MDIRFQVGILIISTWTDLAPSSKRNSLLWGLIKPKLFPKRLALLLKLEIYCCLVMNMYVQGRVCKKKSLSPLPLDGDNLPIVRWIDGCMDKCMHGRMDGRMNRQVDGGRAGR
jgi:hypothetical protein